MAGLVDQQQFLRAQQAIVSACENLSHPSVTQEKVNSLYNIHVSNAQYIPMYTEYQCIHLSQLRQ